MILAIYANGRWLHISLFSLTFNHIRYKKLPKIFQISRLLLNYLFNR